MSEKEYTRKPRTGRKPRRKVCQFCADKVESIDYKDAAKLRRARQDYAPPYDRHLRQASERAGHCHQACKSYGSSSLQR